MLLLLTVQKTEMKNESILQELKRLLKNVGNRNDPHRQEMND